MSTVIDVSIFLFLIMGAIVGFKRGVIKSAVTFLGAIVVIVLAFSLKNPVAKFFYSFCPFFNFAGDFEGLTTLNIIIYEVLYIRVDFLIISFNFLVLALYILLSEYVV